MFVFILDIGSVNDLFAKNNQAGPPIATHLKLIRAPNNPSLYGVLVPENSREIIQQLTGPVFAVIQGPKSKLEIPQKEISKIRKSRSIKYGDLL